MIQDRYSENYMLNPFSLYLWNRSTDILHLNNEDEVFDFEYESNSQDNFDEQNTFISGNINGILNQQVPNNLYDSSLDLKEKRSRTDNFMKKVGLRFIRYYAYSEIFYKTVSGKTKKKTLSLEHMTLKNFTRFRRLPEVDLLLLDQRIQEYISNEEVINSLKDSCNKACKIEIQDNEYFQMKVSCYLKGRKFNYRCYW